MPGDPHRSLSGSVCSPTLPERFDGRCGSDRAERVGVVADAPPIPVGGDRGDGVEPSVAVGGIDRWDPEATSPDLPGLDGAGRHLDGSAFHGLVPVMQGPGHGWVGHTPGSRNEPSDEIGSCLVPTTGGRRPPIDSTVEGGGGIVHIREVATVNQDREGVADVEAAGLSVA
jgi:hypothetical protein